MRLILPSKDRRFRLVQDKPRGTYAKPLPAGTVFAVTSMKLNKTTKRDGHTISCIVMASPDPKLAMVKYGGICEGGHWFVLSINEFEALELDLVEDMP